MANRPPLLRSRAGQSLVEFALSATVATLVVAGAGWLLRAQWERGRCAVIVFETTRARLAGMRLPPGSLRVRMAEDEQGVTGKARCEDATEEVRLPRLEAARW